MTTNETKYTKCYWNAVQSGGYSAYNDGKSIEENPYSDKSKRDTWEQGWRIAEGEALRKGK